ncbi:MAG TPA: NUDIX domain-containing protein [Terriglobales bacterium]|nr:NUDIX domain-containing protein [Terriglobales bacterium]
MFPRVLDYAIILPLKLTLATRFSCAGYNPEMSWRMRLFRVVSRTFIAFYAKFPVFGALRGAIAVVPHGDRYLMVERADGLGLGFPGGLVHPWESPEGALCREVKEETGLAVQKLEPWFAYRDQQMYPTQISVFRADVSGSLRSSWEGEAVMVTIDEIKSRVIINQRRVAEKLSEERKA